MSNYEKLVNQITDLLSKPDEWEHTGELRKLKHKASGAILEVEQWHWKFGDQEFYRIPDKWYAKFAECRVKADGNARECRATKCLSLLGVQ